MKVCAFTGHRNLAFYDFDRKLLEKVVVNLIKNGYEKFLCGMAMGFDLTAAQVVLDLKKKYPVKLVACLPCSDQAERFSEKNRAQYEKILAECDEVKILGYEYTRGCMHRRNRYLVDNSDVLVCFLRRESGGTYYTVQYARRQNRKIIEL